MVVQFFRFSELVTQFVAQQLPVRISPSINTLFYISHDKVTTAFIITLLNQRKKIIPLHPRGILELIDHEMVDPVTGFFIYERRIATVDDPVEQFGGIGQKKNIVFFFVCLNVFVDVAQNP